MKMKSANVRDEFKPIQSHLVVGDPKIVAELEKTGHYNRHPRPRKLRAEHRAAKARAR
jgi:hypothetical protein